MDHSKNIFAKSDQFSLSFSSSSCSCASPVIELQRGNLTERDLRNAGILPAPSLQMSSDTSSSTITAPNTPVPVGKLKEPRDLYSTATLLHPIKWPVECQVIPEKIRHIDSVPSKLEPFYSSSGKEPQPQPVGVEMGTVVYDYQPKLSVDYFCRATVGGSMDLDQFESYSSGENSLKFESRFESGNLAKAIKITNTYYELYLRPDLYTERHAQWFYFRVQGCKEGLQYRFSIVNLNKPDILYRYGLKVLMYSEKEAQLNGVGWTRCGQNIAYFKNDISLDDNGPYYTLTFNLKFRHNNDTVYLAQCYPYTYSTLQHYLKSIEDDEFKSQLLTIRLLCRSLAGNNVHVLTVTSPDNNKEQHRNLETTEGVEAEEGQSNCKKPVIVISARVHPGETQSSYMMKGIIDFLTSDCTQAKELRDRFIFKLIPMLNPDGVIVGNSRCCLLGQDLNRQYRTVLREAFPQIYHAKVMLRRLQEENGIFLYCDLHGHSRRHNVFIYGCENRRVPEKHLMEQVFPLMMHKNAADKFSFQNCKFKIQKNKEGTGRIFVWTLGILNSYTLEISLGGSTMPSRQFTHFNTGDYEACGRHFCETLLDFSDPSPPKETLRDRILHKLIDEGSTADEPKNVVLSDYSSLSHSETDGEDEDSGREEGNDSTGLREEGKALSTTKKLSTNGNSHKNELKRQVSIRKHNFSHSKSKSVAKTPRNNDFNRSPMPVHRAFVDFTQFKQRHQEESFLKQIPIDPIRPNTPENHPQQLTISISAIEKEPPSPSHETIIVNQNSKTKDVSAAYKRLTKFRRKSRKSNSNLNFTEMNSLHSPQQLQLTAKCTRILFDDPFNPPGTSWQRPYYGNRQPNIPIILNDESLGMGLEPMDFNSNSACQSGTEDECDPYDDMTINRGRGAPIIKITECDDPMKTTRSIISTSQDFLHTLAGDMSRLKVSTSATAGKFHRSNSDSESIPSTGSKFSSFSPFSPTFPVGKAFLHQNFYPEKTPTSPAKNSLKNSLSDTTLSDSVNAAASSSQEQQLKSERTPVTRRSSISYGTLSRSPKTSGASILTPKTADLNSRRRVSWTGTLTVSVPTSALPTRSPGGSIHNLDQSSNFASRKKTFRKSTSLNDKKTPSPQSSTELNDSVMLASASMDKIYDGRKGTTRGKLRTAGSISNFMPGTSSAKKKRTKLKRSKHK